MSEHQPNNIFKAIADPTRREILSIMVVATTALSINSISENFSASRQAITKHIGILHEAGLVDFELKGRERFCFANPKPLKEVHDWLAVYEKFWNTKLDMLDKFLGGME